LRNIKLVVHKAASRVQRMNGGQFRTHGLWNSSLYIQHKVVQTNESHLIRGSTKISANVCSRKVQGLLHLIFHTISSLGMLLISLSIY